MEELLKLLGFTTPLIYATAAYGLFHWLDENASDEAKTALSRTMRFKDYKKEQVASALVAVFDQIYTYPLLRWRAFFRSLLFTTVVSVIFVFEMYRYHPLFRLKDWPVTSYGLLFNVLSDYLSLFVIRPLLIRSGTKPVVGLVLGAVAGVAIVLAVNALRIIILMSIGIFMGASTDILGKFAGLTVPWWSPGWFLRLAFVWAALAVFVWLPLFALGIMIVRLLTPLSWLVGRTQWFLKEGKEHPLKAIGCVAAVAVFVGTIAGRAVFST